MRLDELPALNAGDLIEVVLTAKDVTARSLPLDFGAQVTAEVMTVYTYLDQGSLAIGNGREFIYICQSVAEDPQTGMQLPTDARRQNLDGVERVTVLLAGHLSAIHVPNPENDMRSHGRRGFPTVEAVSQVQMAA